MTFADRIPVTELLQTYTDGTLWLPGYVWPGGYSLRRSGGYPLLYFDAYNEVLCATCAAHLYVWATNEKDKPCYGEVFYEGEDERCFVCAAVIESAYGVPEDD